MWKTKSFHAVYTYLPTYLTYIYDHLTLFSSSIISNFEAHFSCIAPDWRKKLGDARKGGDA